MQPKTYYVVWGIIFDRIYCRAWATEAVAVADPTHLALQHALNVRSGLQGILLFFMPSGE